MQTLLLVSMIFGVLIQRSSARLLSDQCGTSMGTRIIGGKNAEMKAADWMAGIRNETQFLCGGTLIHKRFVLTAAHCIEGNGRIFVKLGAYYLSHPVVEYEINYAVIHREYSRLMYQHDIGLLKLPFDIVFTDQIYPICINLHPRMKTIVENVTSFEAYGWGKTQTANMSEVLQRVTLDHRSRNTCNSISVVPLTSYQICAGLLQKKDTCRGDSGGPLIKVVSYKGVSRLTQLGMVSYGLDICEGLGIYTDITRYADWIEENIKNNYHEYSWQTPPTPIHTPFSVIPPRETVSLGVENFSGAQLLSEPCGTPLSTRIIGGHAQQDAAAWVAAVYRETFFTCGGSVIHRRFVLTAAHCCRLSGNLFVKLGVYDTRRPTAEYSVSKKIVHEEYDPRTFIHDIGLLELSRDIQFDWLVYPVCIALDPDFNRIVENASTFKAYGWGTTNYGRPSHMLQEITLNRYDRRECNRRFNTSLHSNYICAGAISGDTCSGDSGGPLTKNVFVNGLHRETQLGITSFGAPNCNGLGGYTDVTSYVDWILRKIR